MLRRIACDEVRKGMFIHGFGGSWFDHPFWRGKFLLETAADVDRVRRSNVPFVEVDDALGLAPVVSEEYADGAPLEAQTIAETDLTDRRIDPRRSHPVPPRADPQRQRAARLLTKSKEVMRGVFEDARLGCAIHSPSMTGVVEDIIDAVTLESQIFLTVARLKSKDDYTYLHSVAVCALMVSTARYLEKSPEETHDLGLAGLLHDVGKMAIPDQILNKPGALNDDEFSNVRTHPEKGYELLKGSAGIPPAALDVCRHHHEKIDGSGYPFGLVGDEISFAARLGAICDVYDALTSNRAYKKAWLPHKALLQMSAWKGHFDPEILAALMQAIEIFPTGLLVKMESGTLALVLGNEAGFSNPRAVTFSTASTHEFTDIETVRLGRRNDEEVFVSVEDPSAQGIANWTEFSEKLREAVQH